MDTVELPMERNKAAHALYTAKNGNDAILLFHSTVYGAAGIS